MVNQTNVSNTSGSDNVITSDITENVQIGNNTNEGNDIQSVAPELLLAQNDIITPESNALAMTTHNNDKIDGINVEISSLKCMINTMREDMIEERSNKLRLERAVVAIFAGLYGKQQEDIKIAYDLNEEEK